MVLAEAMYEGLKAITPPGVDPIMFVLTYILSVALVWPITGIIHFFKDNRPARVFSTFIIAYFIAASGLVTLVISKFFPAVGMSIMVVFGILLVIAMIFPKKVGGKGLGKLGTGLLILAFLIVIWVSWYGIAPELGLEPGVPISGLSPLDWFLIIVVIVIILGILWVLSGGKGEGKEPYLVLVPKE